MMIALAIAAILVLSLVIASVIVYFVAQIMEAIG